MLIVSPLDLGVVHDPLPNGWTSWLNIWGWSDHYLLSNWKPILPARCVFRVVCWTRKASGRFMLMFWTGRIEPFQWKSISIGLGRKKMVFFFSAERWCGGFLKWWYPTTMGFPTKNDHFRVFWGYHHLRKHPCLKIADSRWRWKQASPS